MSSILPPDYNGEVSTTPNKIHRYLDADGLRQLLRNERIRWNLKPNKDSDYFGVTTNFRYSGAIYNEGDHELLEVRSFPDNGGNPGFAGMYIDGGERGMIHNDDAWDESVSRESRESITPRVSVGASSVHDQLGPIKEIKRGYGLNEEGTAVERNSRNRTAKHIYDAYDGRIYILSNDEAAYVNNKTRDPSTRMPARTAARICDVPSDIDDLVNQNYTVSDWDYHHTTNDFNNSHRYILENLDDRTFVHPEIAKDRSGQYIQNRYMGLSGTSQYNEGEGTGAPNSQPDLTGEDRQGDSPNSYNANKAQVPDNPYNVSGYFPGIFRSLEELNKVDLVRQHRTILTHAETPGGRRRHNFYQFDGLWDYGYFGSKPHSYDKPNVDPSDMENKYADPLPYRFVEHQGNYSTAKLYQWRYNRVNVYWHIDFIDIVIQDGGVDYKVGDLLRYSFLSKMMFYRVDSVGSTGEILSGHIVRPNDPVDDPDPEHHLDYVLDHDPSTNGVGVVFKNMTSGGRNARFVILATPVIDVTATQLKNNLYAYVDVVPTVSSDNNTEWSDTGSTTNDPNHIVSRSTAPGPAYSGINSGTGGPEPTPDNPHPKLYEHGGNATAGPHIHLFKYVIDTTGNSYEIVDGVKVYTGKWVDQGPLGVERPCDIKALFLSNPDTNNFNNYYKFMLDLMIHRMNRESDVSRAGGPEGCAPLYIHSDERDPWQQPVDQPDLSGPTQETYSNFINDGYSVELLGPTPENGILDHQAFFDRRYDPATGKLKVVEITHRVLFINEATGVAFYYNPVDKLDPNYGYGVCKRGWHPVVGTVGL